MQLKQALTSAIARLTEQQVPSPRLNAELLLIFILNCDRAYLYAHPERKLSADEATRYESVLAERAGGFPTQYITGHQEFWGMDFIVSPAVLIPRPETEHVIETVLELYKAQLGPQTSDLETDLNVLRPQVKRPTSAVSIVDVGTGSGCIALALAKELPNAEMHATDISSAALEIARANAARHQLESRVHFHHTDLLDGLSSERFDFIVSNPPYVGESEEDEVQLEVRKFEPRNAVFAGPTGVEIIARLIPQARTALKSEGWLVIELSGTIVERVQALLDGWDHIMTSTDLQGIPRVIRAQKPPA